MSASSAGSGPRGAALGASALRQSARFGFSSRGPLRFFFFGAGSAAAAAAAGTAGAEAALRRCSLRNCATLPFFGFPGRASCGAAAFSCIKSRSRESCAPSLCARFVESMSRSSCAHHDLARKHRLIRPWQKLRAAARAAGLWQTVLPWLEPGTTLARSRSGGDASTGAYFEGSVFFLSFFFAGFGSFLPPDAEVSPRRGPFGAAAAGS